MKRFLCLEVNQGEYEMTHQRLYNLLLPFSLLSVKDLLASQRCDLAEICCIRKLNDLLAFQRCNLAETCCISKLNDGSLYF